MAGANSIGTSIGVYISVRGRLGGRWLSESRKRVHALSRGREQRILALVLRSYTLQIDDTHLPVQDRHLAKNIKRGHLWDLDHGLPELIPQGRCNGALAPMANIKLS